ncbi:UNVERIFIED_CONTAM: FecR domain-containing protein, partial [Salmonella enterica subsp. enterica serovar Weltevreden]
GLLELLDGLATLKFASGAEVSLEAPVTLEILSPMECRIRKGTVVAEVPPQAKGFTIHAPQTKVVDYGTRFGVSAGEDGKCLVHVIEGLVEVQRTG